MTEQDKKEYEQWLASTYKGPTEEEREFGDWLYECVNDAMIELWRKHCGQADVETMSDYVAYGDTFVSSGRYITDESDQEIRESFEKNITAKEVVDVLVKDINFRRCIERLVDKWAYEKELEF